MEHYVLKLCFIKVSPLLNLINDVFKTVALLQFALLLGFMSSVVVSTLYRCKLY